MRKFTFIVSLLLIATLAWAGRSSVQTDNFDDNDLAAGSIIWTGINNLEAVMGTAGGQVFCQHSPDCVIISDGTYTDDQYAKLRIAYSPGGGSNGHKIGVFCRGTGTDSTRNYYVYLVDYTNNPMDTILSEVNNGAYVTIDTVNTITWATNDTIEIECEGTTIRGYQNGVLKVTKTDATLTTGNPGIFIQNSLSLGDNFEAGDVTAGGGGGSSIVRHRVTQQ